MYNPIAVSKATAREAQLQILGCESCSQRAEIPLSWILDRITGRPGSQTDYVLGEALQCPQCAAPVTEETLIESE
jgi:hypothetical protein